MTLQEAISAIETTSAAYSKGTDLINGDVAAAAVVQAKLDVLNATTALDENALVPLAVALNSSLESGAAAMLASRVPVPGTKPAAPPVA